MKQKILLSIFLFGIFILALFTRFGMIVTPTTVYIFFSFTTALFITFVAVNKKIKTSLDDPTVLLFIVVIISSLAISPYKYGTFNEILRLLSAIIAGILLMNLLNNKTELKKISYFIVFLGLTLSAISYLFYYSVEFASFPYLAAIAEKYAFVYEDTLSSIWQYQNAFGGFLVLPIFISFYFLLNEKDAIRKILWSFASTFLIFTLIITDSRGAMLVFLFYSLVFITFYPQKNKRIYVIAYWILIILGAYAFALFGASPNTLIKSAEKTEILAKYVAGVPNSSLWQRIYFAKFSLKMLIKHPLLGTGLGTFKDIYCINSSLPDKIRFGPHSIIFRFITETGIAGIVSLIVLLTQLFKKAISFTIKNTEFFGLLIGITAMFTHMCIDIDYPDTILIVLLFAILFSFTFEKTPRIVNKHLKMAIIFVLVILTIFSTMKGIGGIYALKSNTAREQGKIAYAENNIKKAVILDNRNDLYHYIYGGFFRKLATINRCLFQYKTAYSFHRGDFDYPLAIGTVYLDLNNNKLAKEYLKNAEKLYPTNAEIKGLLGIYYARLNEKSKAIQYIEKALSLDSKCSNAYVARGLLYLNNGKENFAKGNFRKAAKLQYNNPYAQLGFLLYYRKKGNKNGIKNSLRYIKKFDVLLYQSITNMIAQQ